MESKKAFKRPEPKAEHYVCSKCGCRFLNKKEKCFKCGGTEIELKPLKKDLNKKKDYSAR